MIRILKACRREIEEFPEDVREDLAAALARLEEGQNLSFPLSRPMPSIGRHVHELRFRDRQGIFRVIYVLVRDAEIWLIAAFKKKTQSISENVVVLIKKRLKDINS